MKHRSIAVVGLGQMGYAIANRLKEKEFRITGWDKSSEACDKALKSGISVANSLQLAVQDADFVITSLPDSSAVRNAWLMQDGIVNHARPGTICIELSTIDPGVMKEIATIAGNRSLHTLDCPVSGGPIEAAAGTLVVMVGGLSEVIEKARDVLESIGTKVMPTGDVGTAKVVKLVNNMMAMGNLLIACEAFSLGELAGVNQQILFEVLSNSGGCSKTFTKRIPPALNGDFSPKFKLSLAAKDLGLGLMMAKEMNAKAPGISMIRDLFSQALSDGFGDQDAVALLAMYRAWHAEANKKND